MTRVIGFHGPRGCGKSTLARHLVDLYNRHYYVSAVQMSFSTPLKRMLGVLLAEAGASEATINRTLYGVGKEDPLPELQGRSMRYALQTLGTDWGRNMIGERLWADIQEKVVQRSSADVVVFDDVRFHTEASLVAHTFQGRLVNIVRPETRFMRDHESETGVPGYDMIEIVNRGDPKAVVHKLMEQLHAA